MAIKVRDAIKALEQAGWKRDRQPRGSHTIFKKPGVPYHISLPTGHRKDIDTGLWEAIKKKAGL